MLSSTTWSFLSWKAGWKVGKGYTTWYLVCSMKPCRRHCALGSPVATHAHGLGHHPGVGRQVVRAPMPPSPSPGWARLASWQAAQRPGGGTATVLMYMSRWFSSLIIIMFISIPLAERVLGASTASAAWPTCPPLPTLSLPIPESHLKPKTMTLDASLGHSHTVRYRSL